MPIYLYKGLNKTGKEVKQEISAESMISAKTKIRAMGVMLVDIKEKKSKKTSGNSLGGAKVSIADLALVTRQFATLVKAKIQIVEALQALVDQVDNETLKVVLSEVRQDVNEGASLAKAMGKHSKVFDSVYINMVEAGEASGNLEIVLLRLADFTEAQMKLKNRINSAMMYPMIMIFVGTVMIGAIFVFVIPKLTGLFTKTKMELPLPTKICIALSNFFQSYWWSIPIIAFTLFWLFRKWRSTPSGARTWDTILLKMIILGDLVRMINVARFCSTLATLLNSGVPILSALNIVKNLVPNLLLKDAIESARESVSEGKSMAEPLAQSGHFPSLVTHMVSLGEKSGELEDMLKIIAENYEDQVEAKVDGLTSLLEPIMIVFLGGAVFFIVLSVIMPMMQLNKIN